MSKGRPVLLWVAAVFLILCTIAYFPSWACILFLVGAIIALPVRPLREFFYDKGVKGLLKAVLIIALFLGGAMIAPTDDTPEPTEPVETVIMTPSQTPEPTSTVEPTPTPTSTPTPTPTSTPTPPPAPTPTPEPTPEEVSEPTVWISQTGSRYHRDPDCSGMNNPRQVTLTEARNMGLIPCGNCY